MQPLKERRRKERGSFIRKWTKSYLLYFDKPQSRLYLAFQKACRKNSSDVKTELLKLMEVYSSKFGTWTPPEQLTLWELLQSLPGKGLK